MRRARSPARVRDIFRAWRHKIDSELVKVLNIVQILQETAWNVEAQHSAGV